MSVEMKEIYEQERKSEICNNILRALPSWFGIETSIIEYAKQVRGMPFCSAIIDEASVGFIAIKDHTPFTSEVCVMGILNEFHRQGIGKKLIHWCEDYCLKNGKEFLTVKTLDESHASKSYEKTRQFYLSVGFKPLEVFPLLWDENNPCLFLAKHISNPHL